MNGQKVSIFYYVYNTLRIEKHNGQLKSCLAFVGVMTIMFIFFMFFSLIYDEIIQWIERKKIEKKAMKNPENFPLAKCYCYECIHYEKCCKIMGYKLKKGWFCCFAEKDKENDI